MVWFKHKKVVEELSGDAKAREFFEAKVDEAVVNMKDDIKVENGHVFLDGIDLNNIRFQTWMPSNVTNIFLY
jgi:hypothetical protein